MNSDDIDLGQWLYGSNGRLILNDMNNAMFVEWNDREQQYCKYYRSFGGFYRSPEEYEGGYHDERVDVWPVGNVLFSLLTGLNPVRAGTRERGIRVATFLLFLFCCNFDSAMHKLTFSSMPFPHLPVLRHF